MKARLVVREYMAEDGKGAEEAASTPVEEEEPPPPVLEQKLRLRFTFQCERELRVAESESAPEEAEAATNEEGGEEADEKSAGGTSVTSVAVRYSLPIFGKFGNSSGSSETQVDLTFEEDGNALSKVEESSHEVTSDEPFIRSFVTNGHSAKVSVSFEAEGDKVTKEETVDLSGLLVGDKVRKARIPFAKFLKGVTMQLHVEKMHVERAEAEAEEGEQEEDQSNEPAYVPCKFLTPDLVDLLNPFVFEISALESLPDKPATIAQLDDLCEPVSIRYTFYDTGSGQKTSSTGTPPGYGEEIWYKGLESGEWTANEVNTVSYRDVKVGGLRVYFLGDCDEDEIYKHFDYDKIPIEVHDRLPTPEDMPNVQIQPEGGEEGEDAKQAEEAAMARSGDKSSAQEGHKTSYVCGLAHISLREFCMGYTSYDNEVNIFPYTSIRGGADLDWKTRPGRYVESGSQVTYLARMAKSLKDPAKHRYFQRAVFLMEYNDNLLLRSILDLVTSVNQQALKLKGSKAYILQTLATYKFDEAQAKSTDLDVLTGFQVIDKSMRLIVVEGLKNGAMSHVRDLVEATTSSSTYTLGGTYHSQKVQESKEEASSDWGTKGNQMSKRILYNPALCYAKRLYTSLGAQIHPIKLSAPLGHIMANCHTHSGRKVREQCREGLKRLTSLCRITWLRQVDRMQLLPTSEMLNYIDKKFGGELTKRNEEGLGSEDKVQSAMGETSDLSLTQFLASAKAVEQESSGVKSSGSKSTVGRSTRYSYSKPHLEMRNTAFEEERQKREAVRKERNFLDEYIKQLPEMEKMAQSIRDEWFTWNPQRLRSFRSPLQQIKAVRAFQAMSPPKTAEKKEEVKVDPRPEFIFPVPKSPGQYNSHPKRPTKARKEELEQPWIENEFYGSLMRYDDESDIVPFKTIMPAPAILEKNPDFFTSVHLCGEGLIKEQEEAKQQEIEKWNSKVVVDDVHFYSIIKSRKQVSQTDRHEITLKGPPMKKGFQISHAQPIPTSVHFEEPYEEEDDKFFRRKVDPSKFIAGDFVRHIHGRDNKVYKPNLKSAVRSVQVALATLKSSSPQKK